MKCTTRKFSFHRTKIVKKKKKTFICFTCTKAFKNAIIFLLEKKEKMPSPAPKQTLAGFKVASKYTKKFLTF